MSLELWVLAGLGILLGIVWLEAFRDTDHRLYIVFALWSFSGVLMGLLRNLFNLENIPWNLIANIFVYGGALLFVIEAFLRLWPYPFLNIRKLQDQVSESYARGVTCYQN
jgi:predicted membrane channel-forming protein YqfA (hemolysin III family)